MTVSRSSGEKPGEGGLEHFAGLAASQNGVGAGFEGAPVLEHRQLVLNRIRGAVQFGAAIVINQNIAGQTGQPDREGDLAGAKTADGLEERAGRTSWVRSCASLSLPVKR